MGMSLEAGRVLADGVATPLIRRSRSTGPRYGCPGCMHRDLKWASESDAIR